MSSLLLPSLSNTYTITGVHGIIYYLMPFITRTFILQMYLLNAGKLKKQYVHIGSKLIFGLTSKANDVVKAEEL